MTIIEKEKDISKYIKEWTDARLSEWDQFRKYVSENRRTGIYRLKNGSGMLDLLNDIVDSIEHHLICGDDKPIIPTKFSSLDDVIGALNNFRSILKSKFDLLTPYLKEDNNNDDVVTIARMCYEIEAMVKRCNDVYEENYEIPKPYVKAKEYLNECNIKGFIELLKSIIEGVPYNMHRQKMNESHFHTIIHVITTILGFSIVSELATASGRIDLKINCPNYIYIFEFKYDAQNKDLSNEAISQIKRKRYHLAEIINGKKIIGVGVSFGKAIRNINGHKQRVLYKPEVNIHKI